MPCKIPGFRGFLLLETLAALFILGLAAGFGFYLLKTNELARQKVKSKIFADLLAIYQMEKILSLNFSEIISFKTEQNPADEWSQEIQKAPLKNAAGEVAVLEIESNLKKVAVTVFYQIGPKNEKVNLETLVVK